jgi:hypothetical protein
MPLPEQPTEYESPEGPTLRDCEALIARIDGTIAALARERRALERRVSLLTQGGPQRNQPHAAD